MTDLTERRMLAVRGTRDIELPPSAILSVAKADFERRLRNKARMVMALDEPFERFGFLGSHVKNARSPAAILRAALKWKMKLPLERAPRPTAADPEAIDPGPKLSVLHLTASLDNLKLAIELAEKEESHAIVS